MSTLITRHLRIAAIAAVILTVPHLAHSARPQRQSEIRRYMEAARQLREYRARNSAAGMAKSAQFSREMPAQVGIRINKAVHTSSTIYFYDDFESGAHTWTTELYGGSTDDIWHATTLNASSPTHSRWPGVELQSNYNTGRKINTAVVSEPINLAAAVGPVTLLFAENYVTENGWDDCMVDVSTDAGVTWTHLRGGYGAAPSGDSHGWKVTSLNLSAYAGQIIKIRFYFDTGDDRFNDFPGWFVDDVTLFDQGGTITGKKFFDVNNNGSKDPGERGIKYWPITASGPITVTATTNERGRYRLTLPLGSYTLTEGARPGWSQTYPLSGSWAVNLATADTVVDSIHFGNWTHASFINGTKYNDLNHSGSVDGGDTALPEWKIVLADTDGNAIDFDYTDSLGQYSLYVFQPGRYVVREEGKAGWTQSYPPDEVYKIDIPDLNTTSVNNHFANYLDGGVSELIGMKFNDLNRDGIKDPHEPGLPGFTIRLSGTINRKVKTDSSGFYDFTGVPPGGYHISEDQQAGWWKSVPASGYDLSLDSAVLVDSLDFGNYAIVPGSLGGILYEDSNGNGLKDTSEGGLSGWRIDFSGTTYFGSSAYGTTTTDLNGMYSFGGLWPGNYTVSELFRGNWRQTQPANLKPYHMALGAEENRTGVDFGNHRDSTFSLSFRTFLPESLALGVDRKGKHKPVQPKPDKIEFLAEIVNSESTAAAKLRITLGVGLTDSLGFDRPGTEFIVDAHMKTFELTFTTPVDTGDTVRVWGFGRAPKVQTAKYRWKFPGDVAGPVRFSPNFPTMVYRYPMPNTINLLSLTGQGLKVGTGGAHSVVHGRYQDVQKSLIDSHERMHLGDPRCLAVFSNGRSITTQQKSLSPTKGNNKLFAEAIALQTNIVASDAGITPDGFGNLIFDEGTGIDSLHPFNGRSVREIAGMLDVYMSSAIESLRTARCDTAGPFRWITPWEILQKIRMIDSGFSGRMDTISFAGGLVLSPVRLLSAVPYMRLDSSGRNRPFASRRPLPQPLPEVYSLSQNYPNPFNPATVIEFFLPVQSVVTLKVFNTLGQEVQTVVDREPLEDGTYQYEVSGSKLASGVYYYRLVAEPVPDEDSPKQVFTSSRKMILLK